MLETTRCTSAWSGAGVDDGTGGGLSAVEVDPAVNPFGRVAARASTCAGSAIADEPTSGGVTASVGSTLATGGGIAGSAETPLGVTATARGLGASSRGEKSRYGARHQTPRAQRMRDRVVSRSGRRRYRLRAVPASHTIHDDRWRTSRRDLPRGHAWCNAEPSEFRLRSARAGKQCSIRAGCAPALPVGATKG